MYQEMYLHLFNAVTDALAELEEQNFGIAAQLLMMAQRACEEMYLDGSEKP